MFGEYHSKSSALASTIGIAGIIGVGVAVGGLMISSQGRQLVREALHRRCRSRLEDRILELLWEDPMVGLRDFDVRDTGDGVVELSGVVRSRRERARALRLARSVEDVAAVEDRLLLVPPHHRGRHNGRRRPRREPIRIED